MEHRNASRFREAHTAMNSGDLRPFVDFLADDIEWWDTGAPHPIRGRAAVEVRLQQFAEFNTMRDLHDLFANDEHLVALIHANAERDGSKLDYSTAEVYHFSDEGLIQKRQAFAQDTAVIFDFFA